MAAIQILAAGTAGVQRIHFWYGYSPEQLDKTAVERGIEVANALSGKTTDQVLNLLTKSGYSWGRANENHVSNSFKIHNFFSFLIKEFKAKCACGLW
jgi:hypothetical protein